jgi:hypothetical protein
MKNKKKRLTKKEIDHLVIPELKNAQEAFEKGELICSFCRKAIKKGDYGIVEAPHGKGILVLCDRGRCWQQYNELNNQPSSH